jgi:hypothetical protein
MMENSFDKFDANRSEGLHHRDLLGRVEPFLFLGLLEHLLRVGLVHLPALRPRSRGRPELHVEQGHCDEHKDSPFHRDGHDHPHAGRGGLAHIAGANLVAVLALLAAGEGGARVAVGGAGAAHEGAAVVVAGQGLAAACGQVDLPELGGVAAEAVVGAVLAGSSGLTGHCLRGAVLETGAAAADVVLRLAGCTLAQREAGST